MSELRALIFDVDGTLADTEREGHRVAFNRAFEEAGYDWNWSDSLYSELLAVTGGKERLRFYLNDYRPDFQPPEDLEQFIVRIHALKNKHYQELLAAGAVPLRPGVKRLIAEARENGVRLAISTTSAVPNVLAVLGEMLDPAWFEVIAAGDMVATKKPAPDIYYYALEQMDLSAADCLVIEDSHHGFQAAHEAGLKAVVTVNEYTKTEDFTGACLVLDSLGEPNQPFRVLAGDAGGATYADLALLRRLHEGNGNG